MPNHNTHNVAATPCINWHLITSHRTRAGSCRSRRSRQAKAGQVPWSPEASETRGRRPCPSHRPGHHAAAARSHAPQPASSRPTPPRWPPLSQRWRWQQPEVAVLARRWRGTATLWSRSHRRGRPARSRPASWRLTSCSRKGGCACGVPWSSPRGASWRACCSSSSWRRGRFSLGAGWRWRTSCSIRYQPTKAGSN